MKTAIVYASRKGFSKSIAELIAKQMSGDVSLLDIRRKPDISAFDRVVLGGSVIAGEIRMGIKKYALKHENELLSKKLALFVCCIEQKPENIKKYIETSFPGSIVEHAITVEQVGGSYVPEKENFIIRFFFGKMGMKGYNLIKEDAIKRLADSMRDE